MDRTPAYNTLAGRTAALLRHIAKADIGDAGIWLLDSGSVYWSHPEFDTQSHGQPGNLCLGLTHALLPIKTYRYRRRLGFFRGDQDFVAVMSDVASINASSYTAIAIHEFAHRLADINDRYTAAHVIDVARRGQLEQFLGQHNLNWQQQHDGIFVRCLAHLWTRARLIGFDVDPMMLRPGYASFPQMIAALGDEPARNLTGSIKEVLDAPSPATFTRLTNGIGYRIPPAVAMKPKLRSPSASIQRPRTRNPIDVFALVRSREANMVLY